MDHLFVNWSFSGPASRGRGQGAREGQRARLARIGRVRGGRGGGAGADRRGGGQRQRQAPHPRHLPASRSFPGAARRSPSSWPGPRCRAPNDWCRRWRAGSSAAPTAKRCAASPSSSARPVARQGCTARQGLRPDAAQSAAGAQPTPPTSIPEPRWAPSTGPTWVQKSGSVPKISSPSATRAAASSEAWACWTIQSLGAALVQLVQVGDHPLHRPLLGPDFADRGDLGAEGEDRFDLQGRADQGLGGADAPALAQVLEGVEAEPHVEAVAGLAATASTTCGSGCPCAAASAAARTRQPSPPAPVWPSTTSTRPRQPFVLDHPRRLAGALVGAGEAGGDVDRDDVAAGFGQRLVARRGSRRPRAARWRAGRRTRAGGRRTRRGRTPAPAGARRAQPT